MTMKNSETKQKSLKNKTNIGRLNSMVTNICLTSAYIYLYSKSEIRDLGQTGFNQTLIGNNHARKVRVNTYKQKSKSFIKILKLFVLAEW